MTQTELVVPLRTPFTGDLQIDAAALKREIDYVIADCGATIWMPAKPRRWPIISRQPYSRKG